MYTVDQLAELGGVSARQVTEWNRDGLLPTPERPPVPGSRGRGPLCFPEPAPDAVQWLALHRQSIKGVPRTKAWLWFEGFDYVDLDLEKLQAAYESVAAVLRRFTPTFSDKSAAPTNCMDAIKNGVSQMARKTEEARGWRSYRTERVISAVIAALVGVRTTGEDSINTFSPTEVFQTLESFTSHSGERMPVGGVEIAPNLSTKDFLTILSIPDTFKGQCDIQHARLVWRMFGSVVELGADDPSFQPLIRFWTNLRRKAYARDPYMAILAFAILGAVIVREDDIGPLARRCIAGAKAQRAAKRAVADHSPAAT